MRSIDRNSSPLGPRPTGARRPPTAGPAAKHTPPTRTLALARQHAEHLWFDRATETSSFRQIGRVAQPVNAPAREPRDGKVRDEIKANQAQEAAKLKKLSPAPRAQYATVVAQTARDPEARLALQLLLLEDKLSDSARANDGKRLLQHLAHLAQQPLAHGIQRKRLVSDLVQEIAFPAAINQQDRNTCTVTSLQILMAMKKPAEYVRLIAGLASPGGTVRMASGAALNRSAGTAEGEKLVDVGDDGKKHLIADKRSISARLWQAALMEYGDGPRLEYSNRTDLHTDGTAGLDVDQVGRILEGLTGKAPKVYDTDDDLSAAQKSALKDRMIAELQRRTARGRAVLVGLEWGDKDASGETHDGHELLVTGFKDGRVYYDNPWGQEESMTLADFKARLDDSAMPADSTGL